MDYRFGFNGQEKVNEIAGIGNHTTALFWEYDTRIARRWNLDPVDQISISNYAVMGLNPIWRNDILGDKWKDQASKNQAASFATNTNKLLNQLESKKLEISGDLATARGGRKRRLETELSNVNSRIAEGSAALQELAILGDENNPTIYELRPEYPSGGGDFLSDQGRTFYENGTVVMQFGAFSDASKAHELKHGYQFEVGQISFNKSTGKGGVLYDQTDEHAAYRRDDLFTSPITKPLNPRIGQFGHGYSSRPAISLTTSTTIFELRRQLDSGYENSRVKNWRWPDNDNTKVGESVEYNSTDIMKR